MYGAIIAVSDDAAGSLAAGGVEAIMNGLAEAHFEPDDLASFDVDKLWQVVGLVFVTLIGEEVPAPWGGGGRPFLPADTDPEVARRLSESGLAAIDELFEEFGDQVVEIVEGAGYGPAMLLTSGEVQALAHALDQVGEEQLRAAAAESVTGDTYPVMDGAGPGYVDEVVGIVRRLRSFVSEASARGDALVYGIT